MAKITLEIDTEAAMALSDALSKLDEYAKVIKDGERERVVTNPYKMSGGLRMSIANNLRGLEATVEAYTDARKRIFIELKGDDEFVQGADDMQRFMARDLELRRHPAEIETRTIGDEELRLDVNPIPGTVLANLLCCEVYKLATDKVEVEETLHALLQLNSALAALNGRRREIAEGANVREVIDPYKLSVDTRKTIANNLRALKPVVRAIEDLKEAERLKMAGGEDVMPSTLRDEWNTRTAAAMKSTKWTVELHTLKEADLKLDSNELPNAVTAGLSLVIVEMRNDEVEKETPKDRTLNASERKAEAALKTAEEAKLSEHVASKANGKAKKAAEAPAA